MHLITIGKAAFIILLAFMFVPVLGWLERKGSAFIQDRVGPNRASLMGLRLAGFMHNISDVLKLLVKEMMIPARAQRFYFVLAPFIGVTFAFLAFAVIPIADNLDVGGLNIPMYVVDLNAALVFILAITSLHVFGIVLAGWSSNNKFALLGGLRSTAQMISYELPMGLSIVGMFMVFGTAHLNEIVRGQGELLFGFLPRWGVFVQPLGFILFIVSAFAETNRNPFDLPEGESEILGFHVEYSGFRYILFLMGEYVAVALSGALIATLFFGGWQIPYLPTERLVANAGTVLRVLLAGGFLMSLLSVIFFIGYGRFLKGTWNDKRDQEGLILAALAGLAAAACAILAYFLWNATLPDWGARTVTVIAQFGMFLIKMLFFCWLFIWVRWTLPRFRYDQLMRLGWKNLVPLAFFNIFATGIVLLLISA